MPVCMYVCVCFCVQDRVWDRPLSEQWQPVLVHALARAVQPQRHIVIRCRRAPLRGNPCSRSRFVYCIHTVAYLRVRLRSKAVAIIIRRLRYC